MARCCVTHEQDAAVIDTQCDPCMLDGGASKQILMLARTLSLFYENDHYSSSYSFYYGHEY